MLKKIFPYMLLSIGLILILVGLFQILLTSYNQEKIVSDYYLYIKNKKFILESSPKTNSDAINKIEKLKNNDESLKQTFNRKIKEQNTIDIKSDDITGIISNDNIIGILEIPKLDVNVAILEGTDDRALKYTVGYYPGTAKPGESGNCVLLGHRNYVYGHYFRHLDKLQLGDTVIIRTIDNDYTYTVSDSFVVKPEDTWVLKQNTNFEITMITCTPVGDYSNRLIVKGVLNK